MPELTRAQRYEAHLDRLADGVKPDFYRIDSTHPGQEPIAAYVYQDVPEPGMLLGITYGLSRSNHPDWLKGKPELIISVRSTDVVWALTIAAFAEELRGVCPFTYGGTLNHGRQISTESEMTAFATFESSALELEDSEVDLGDCMVYLTGCYPIYESERKFIQANGVEAFFKLEWDVNDVRRPPVV